MRDEESLSLWDHITGECFDGPLTDERLDFWPVQITTVEAELARNPDVVLLKSDSRRLVTWMMGRVLGDNVAQKEGTTLLSHFRRSMHSEIDPRLPEGEQGLGLIGPENEGRFYPLAALPRDRALIDEWQGRTIEIEVGPLDGMPTARWADQPESAERPMQLLTRWYGFSFTYPGCEIFSQERQMA